MRLKRPVRSHPRTRPASPPITLSMKPSAILAVKHLLRSLSLAEAKQMAREALTLSSSREIEDMMQRQIGERLPHGYACVVHSG